MSSGCKDSNRQQQHSQTARQFLHWFIHNSNPFSLFLVWTFLCITNTHTHTHTHTHTNRHTKAKAQAPMGLRLQAVQLLVLLGLVCSASVQAWVNDFRQPLDYSCSSGGFRLLESYHSDRKSEYFSPPFPLREREEQSHAHRHTHTHGHKHTHTHTHTNCVLQTADRRWNFACRTFGASGSGSTSFHENVNDRDKVFSFQCPSNQCA